MSKKIIMWQKTFYDLKRQLMTMYNGGFSWSQLEDKTKEKILNRINTTLGRKFTIKQIDYIWRDIELHETKHIVIVDKEPEKRDYGSGREL